jgi:hypothetical protein
MITDLHVYLNQSLWFQIIFKSIIVTNVEKISSSPSFFDLKTKYGTIVYWKIDGINNIGKTSIQKYQNYLININILYTVWQMCHANIF